LNRLPLNHNVIVGLGHRARQGKDEIASHIQQTYANVFIVHWADALYQECRNESRKYPLLRKSGLDIEALISEDSPAYDINPARMSEELKELLFKDSDVYWGMDEKNGPLLQWWGTDYRRASNPDYWIYRTGEIIARKINQTPAPLLALIPDTRFSNEIDMIRSFNRTKDFFGAGYYVEVVRRLEDGERFITPDRPKDHPSEASLDVVFERREYDFLVECQDGDLESLKQRALELAEQITIKTNKG